MGAGLVPAHTVALLEFSLLGKSQIDAWVSQRGVGGVVIFLQVLLQQAVVRKLLLEKTVRKIVVIVFWFLYAALYLRKVSYLVGFS